MEVVSGVFTISEGESAKFAHFSGDHNPLHVDRLAARRLQFGDTVIHGVHHMLSSLDAALSRLSQSSVPPETRVATLRVTFPSPVRVGQQISWEASLQGDGTTLNVIARADKKRIMDLTLGLVTDTDEIQLVDTIGSPVSIEQPVDQKFPPQHERGECALHCDDSLAQGLFPCLMRHFGKSRIAQLIACTRVVGMKCPGLHSVFSGISVSFHKAAENSSNPVLSYRVTASDNRVEMLKISVDGPEMTGTLDAFFRPAPVQQPSFASILNDMPGGRFVNQRALVIGGSRGIGETTTKILAAGGADVTITYNSGMEDALKVQKEILDGAGKCEALELDVLTAMADDYAVLAGHPCWSHVYYFASPKIESDRTPGWNNALFQKYCRFYVEAFHCLVTVTAPFAKICGAEIAFFYPSSVFVDQPEKGFAEYAVAKASGEALCNQLQLNHANTQFYAPRLPRMTTDQTSSIVPVKSEPTLLVMDKQLSRWSAERASEINTPAYSGS